MNKQAHLLQVRTHDAYLRAVGAITEVAEELIRFALPKKIYHDLDLQH